MLYILLALFFTATASIVETVNELDINLYVGHWYQVYGSFTSTILQGYGECITADYNLLSNGNISVISSQLNEDHDADTINGYAYYRNATIPGQLTVHYDGVLWEFPHWVVQLGKVVNGEYQYSIVTTPSQVSVWVLARDIDTFYELYDKEVKDFLYENQYSYRRIKHDNCNVSKNQREYDYLENPQNFFIKPYTTLLFEKQ